MIANETTSQHKGHCTAFDNEQNPYHIASYKRAEIKQDVKQFK